jgi:hypothetical protein
MPTGDGSPRSPGSDLGEASPPGRARTQVSRILWLFAGSTAALLLITLATAWAARWSYPYDLEWTEGAWLAHAWRVQRGLPLYAAPTSEWIPLMVSPVYPWLLSVWGDALGAPAGRVVSLLASVGTMVAIAVVVVRRGGSSLRYAAGAGAAAIYAGTWVDAGTAHDLVRADALAVVALVVAVALILERGWPVQIAAGAICAIAASIHPPLVAMLPVLIVAVWIAHRDARIALSFAGTALTVVAVVAATAHVQTGGEIWPYLIAVPWSHGLIGARLWPAGAWEIAIATPFALLICLAGLFSPSSSPGRTRAVHSLAFVTLSALALTLVLRAHHGGHATVYLPFFAMLAMTAGVAAAQALKTRARSLAIPALFALHLGSAWWRTDTASLIPTAVDRQVGDSVVARLRTLDGPIWSPVNPWLPALVGQAPGPHLIALWDVTHHPEGPWPESGAQIRDEVLAGRWRYALEPRRPIGFGVDEATLEGRRLAMPPRAFTPKRGWRYRPEVLRELAPRP